MKPTSCTEHYFLGVCMIESRQIACYHITGRQNRMERTSFGMRSTIDISMVELKRVLLHVTYRRTCYCSLSNVGPLKRILRNCFAFCSFYS